MKKPPELRIRASSDQRFVRNTHRRVVRRQRFRLLAWLLLLAALGAFYYLVGHNLVLGLWSRMQRSAGEWKRGTDKTLRRIQEREATGQQRQ